MTQRAQLLVRLRWLVTLASRLVAARLALACAAIAAHPAGDWACCFVGAAAIAGSLSPLAGGSPLGALVARRRAAPLLG